MSPMSPVLLRIAVDAKQSFGNQELKERVTALEEEKARAFAEVGGSSDRRCAQQ
jgi:uncharacterized small protein (DUF1192 family)